MHQEDRGRLPSNSNVGREDILVYLHTRGLLFNEIARIDSDGKVRPATYLVDLVDRFVGALVEMRRRCHGKVPARRETKDANPLDSPVRGTAAHQTDCPLRVQKRTGSGQRLGLT